MTWREAIKPYMRAYGDTWADVEGQITQYGSFDDEMDVCAAFRFIVHTKDNVYSRCDKGGAFCVARVPRNPVKT